MSDSFRVSCWWINRETDSSDSDLIYSEWSLTSVEDWVKGLWETSETIASECDVTFELYRTMTQTHKLYLLPAFSVMVTHIELALRWQRIKLCIWLSPLLLDPIHHFFSTYIVVSCLKLATYLCIGKSVYYKHQVIMYMNNSCVEISF